MIAADCHAPPTRDAEQQQPFFLQRVVQTYSSPQVLRETVTVVGGSAVVETKTEFSMAQQDRELITRYSTSIDNTVAGRSFSWEEDSDTIVDNAEEDRLPAFETDSNGYLMMSRVTNKTMWGKDEAYYHVTMPVAGNYYPLSGYPGAIRISSSDNSSEARSSRGGSNTGIASLALLTDTAHGASSLQRGWIEVMLGRRVAEGQGISVDDTDEVVATNWLIAGTTAADAAIAHRLKATQVSTPLVPIVVGKSTGMVAEAAVIRDDAVTNIREAVQASLPPQGVHLLSLDRVGVETTAPDQGGRTILRLMNIFQEGEQQSNGRDDHQAGSLAASTLTVDLATLLAPAGVALAGGEVFEVYLNGLGERRRIDLATSGSEISLAPLQIRTFDVRLVPLH